MKTTIDAGFYIKNGYYLYKEQLFAPEKFNRLTAIFEELQNSTTGIRTDEFDTPHFKDKRLLEFLLDERVLDMVENLIGPNIGLWSSHFISKEPFTGRRTPWHEDSAYWNGRFDRLDKIVTVWLALDDSTLENGCMGVIPKSHHNGFSQYEKVDSQANTFTEEIVASQVNVEKVVWFELNKGECSLHDARIIHGANANTSAKRRCGYTMRYFQSRHEINRSSRKHRS
ncbi:MAG: phytanoyl-CoA dioxygenase family protein [Bacteroidales bacterium]|nr:phytanoyl-CoA dioxygenase family protein [Bacteroidales bacterium]